MLRERRCAHAVSRGKCPHHDTTTLWQRADAIAHQVPELPLDPVAVDGRTHGLAHDETDGRGSAGSRNDMCDEGWLYAFGPTTDRVPEVIPAAHALTAREQGLRQTAWRGPCGDGPRGSRGRRGCACGGGSRASWHDDGCSAGKYACSRCVPHGSQSGPVDGHRSPTTENCSCRGHAAEVVLGRLDNGTGGPDPGQTDPHTRPTRSRPHDTPIAGDGLGNSACTRPPWLLASPRYRPFPQGRLNSRVRIHTMWKTMWTCREALDE